LFGHCRGIINRPQYAKEYLESPSSEDMTGPKSQARRLASQDTRLERSGFVKMIVTGMSTRLSAWGCGVLIL
jgi:hypothetical protein